MNVVNLVGRIAKDPTTRSFGNTTVTEVIPVTERPRIRDGKTEKDPQTGYTLMDSEFHKIVIFNGMGKGVRDHKEKGDKLAVTGSIHYSQWTDSDNIKRYGCEIRADNVEFI